MAHTTPQKPHLRARSISTPILPSSTTPTSPIFKKRKLPKTKRSNSQMRTSQRFSTYSTTAPSLTPTTDSERTAEIRELGNGLDKLENKKLAQQRYNASPEKTETLSKLALGAKLERALDRRLNGQDAEFRVKKPKSVETRDQEKTAAAAVAA